ncbi:hypothetical protein HDV62DRAFT_357841 [Trichoderma sp. SZMC 28011]
MFFIPPLSPGTYDFLIFATSVGSFFSVFSLIFPLVIIFFKTSVSFFFSISSFISSFILLCP